MQMLNFLNLNRAISTLLRLYKPFMWNILQQRALETDGNVGQFSEPVGAGGTTVLLVRHSCADLK